MRRAATLLLVLAMVALAACGWRLRGQGAASLEGRSLAVDTTAVSAETRAPLLRAMRAAGAELTEDRAAADAVLVLLGESTQQRPAAIGADARVQEYEQAYTLRVRLETPAGEPIIADESIQVSEVYQYDSSNVLSTQSRATRVTERLRQDAMRLLLPRVQAALSTNMVNNPVK